MTDQNAGYGDTQNPQPITDPWSLWRGAVVGRYDDDGKWRRYLIRDIDRSSPDKPVFSLVAVDAELPRWFRDAVWGSDVLYSVPDTVLVTEAETRRMDALHRLARIKELVDEMRMPDDLQMTVTWETAAWPWAIVVRVSANVAGEEVKTRTPRGVESED